MSRQSLERFAYEKVDALNVILVSISIVSQSATIATYLSKDSGQPMDLALRPSSGRVVVHGRMCLSSSVVAFLVCF